MGSPDEDIRRLRARLCEQAFLFDDPDTYLAGVEDALAEMGRLYESPPHSVHARLSTASRRQDHLVEFYESDEFLVHSVVQFLTPTLGAGEAAIIVATRQHRDQSEAALTAAGFDVTGARECGHLVVLDSAQTLAAFLVDGTPDPARFRRCWANSSVGRQPAAALSGSTETWRHCCVRKATSPPRSRSKTSGTISPRPTPSRCCVPTRWAPSIGRRAPLCSEPCVTSTRRLFRARAIPSCLTPMTGCVQSRSYLRRRGQASPGA